MNLGLDLEPLAPGMIGRALEVMSGVANFSLSLIPLDWQCYALGTNYGINGHDLLNAFLQERILRMVALGCLQSFNLDWCAHHGLDWQTLRTDLQEN